MGLTFVLLFAAACADLFGPSSQTTPQLAQLVFDDLFADLHDGGLIYVDGTPADAAFRLERGKRVPIEITVSSGDRESAGLSRAYCPFTDRVQWGHFGCFRFDIYMQAGFDARSLANRVTAIGGRFDLMSVTGSLAGVTLFSPDNVVTLARAAGSWPGVDHTELSFAFCSSEPGTQCLPFPLYLAVPLPVDTGTAIAADGILEVRSGDTVVATYHQPSGELLQTRAVVP